MIAASQQPVQRLLERPATLKALCDSFAAAASTPAISSRDLALCTNSGRTSFISSLPKNMLCTCREIGGFKIRTRHQSLETLSMYLYRDTHTEEHLPDCPLSRKAEKGGKQTVGIKLFGLARFLGATVDISFATRFGAGGWALSPGFTYHPTVDETSAPAFRIMELLCVCLYVYNSGQSLPHVRRTPVEYSSSELDQFVGAALTKVVRMFGGGAAKASPLDVDSRNRTLIHYATRMVSFSPNISHTRHKALSPSSRSAVVNIHGNGPLNSWSYWLVMGFLRLHTTWREGKLKSICYSIRINWI